MSKLKKIKVCINYAWRILGTGLSFILFAIGSLILAYMVTPIISLITKNRSLRALRVQQAISLAFRFFIASMRYLGVVKCEFHNFDQLKNDRGCLIVSNHPTLIDYVAIASRLKHCETVVKQSLFNNFFVKRIVQAAGYIPNTQSIATFEHIKHVLAKQHNVLLFPEGTRSEPNQPLKLQRGAANIAIRANAPIRLIKINYNESTLTKNSKWYNIPSEQLVLTITVGELVDSQAFLTNAGSPSLAARHLTRHLKQVLEERK